MLTFCKKSRERSNVRALWSPVSQLGERFPAAGHPRSGRHVRAKISSVRAEFLSGPKVASRKGRPLRSLPWIGDLRADHAARRTPASAIVGEIHCHAAAVHNTESSDR